MFTILDYTSALEYSIIRRYTNIVYYYLLLSGFILDVLKKADGLCENVKKQMLISSHPEQWHHTEVFKLCHNNNIAMGVS